MARTALARRSSARIEDHNGIHIILPQFYRDAPELAAQYVQAFEKVWAHRTELAKD